MKSYYLGLDGGGTKTAAVIVDADGREIGRGTGGAGNLAHQTDDALLASVHAAVAGACHHAGFPASPVHFNSVCAGMAGYSALQRRSAFDALLRTAVAAEIYCLEPDYVTAYWGATHGEAGIVMIAGTGAVAYGCNRNGEAAREDGLGYLLGDHGSGVDLGLCALRYTVTQLRRGHKDELTAAVLAFVGAQRDDELIQWLYHEFQPARVAALAPVLGRLAEAGNPAAREHIALMAHRLRATVAQLRSRLQMPSDIPVYPLGGLWNVGRFLRQEFEEPHRSGERHKSDAAGAAERLQIASPRNDAAHGAALLAQKRAKASGKREK